MRVRSIQFQFSISRKSVLMSSLPLAVGTSDHFLLDVVKNWIMSGKCHVSVNINHAEKRFNIKELFKAEDKPKKLNFTVASLDDIVRDVSKSVDLGSWGKAIGDHDLEALGIEAPLYTEVERELRGKGLLTWQ
jgi:hypothetical protein